MIPTSHSDCSTGKKYKGPRLATRPVCSSQNQLGSLMQTCRAPLSFISLFLMSEDWNLTPNSTPKKWREKGKREKWLGFQIIHMFLSSANWIKRDWKWLSHVSNAEDTWSLTHFLQVYTHTDTSVPTVLFSTTAYNTHRTTILGKQKKNHF